MSRRTVHFPDSLDDLENPPYPPEPPFAMVESREAEYERLMAESMSVMPPLPLPPGRALPDLAAAADAGRARARPRQARR